MIIDRERDRYQDDIKAQNAYNYKLKKRIILAASSVFFLLTIKFWIVFFISLLGLVFVGSLLRWRIR